MSLLVTLIIIIVFVSLIFFMYNRYEKIENPAKALMNMKCEDKDSSKVNKAADCYTNNLINYYGYNKAMDFVRAKTYPTADEVDTNTKIAAVCLKKCDKNLEKMIETSFKGQCKNSSKLTEASQCYTDAFITTFGYDKAHDLMTSGKAVTDKTTLDTMNNLSNVCLKKCN